MADVKLKPCPFCGGGAVIQSARGFYPIYAVICLRCYAGGAPSKTEEEAAKAWNKRVDNESRGKWLHLDDEMRCWCSKCGYEINAIPIDPPEPWRNHNPKFCPNCGARMGVSNAKNTVFSKRLTASQTMRTELTPEEIKALQADTVYEIKYNHCCSNPNLDFYSIDENRFSLDMLNKIGKAVFLSREEAEKALKEINKREN